jgi:methylmalonyl-CoA epimerase
MVATRMDHLAIKVGDLQRAVGVLQRVGFRLEEQSVHSDVGLEVAFLSLGGFEVELLRSLGEGSPIHGDENGLLHLAVRCPDVEEAGRQLEREEGVEVIGAPRLGGRGHRVLFVRIGPGNTVLELVEEG